MLALKTIHSPNEGTFNMKLSLLAVIAVGLVSVAGCAANPALEAKVAEQHQEIETLSAKAAKCNTGLVAGDLKTDAVDMASAAWTWVSSEAHDGAVYTKNIASCYHANSSNVHSFEDSRTLMARCYNEH
jgi:outer membrane murein-binding lipoprotein Lpp